VSRLRPFLSYYGGKWATARLYPRPEHDRIIEPFAGSAGYALSYPERDVLLVDKSPAVAGTWDYLIRTPADEIRRLPLLEPGEHVDTLQVCQEARWLIGWWLNKGAAMPHKTLSAWARDPRYASQFWGERIRERIASQVDAIRHWRVLCAEHEDIPDQVATWFVDPPYNNAAGVRYPFSDLDYPRVGDWCRSRAGQVIVCENLGADWLPFAFLAHAKATTKNGQDRRSAEVIWTNVMADQPADGFDPYSAQHEVLYRTQDGVTVALVAREYR
jgi:hypothetical protein